MNTVKLSTAAQVHSAALALAIVERVGTSHFASRQDETREACTNCEIRHNTCHYFYIQFDWLMPAGTNKRHGSHVVARNAFYRILVPRVASSMFSASIPIVAPRVGCMFQCQACASCAFAGGFQTTGLAPHLCLGLRAAVGLPVHVTQHDDRKSHVGLVKLQPTHSFSSRILSHGFTVSS